MKRIQEELASEDSTDHFKGLSLAEVAEFPSSEESLSSQMVSKSLTSRSSPSCSSQSFHAQMSSDVDVSADEHPPGT